MPRRPAEGWLSVLALLVMLLVLGYAVDDAQWAGRVPGTGVSETEFLPCGAGARRGLGPDRGEAALAPAAGPPGGGHPRVGVRHLRRGRHHPAGGRGHPPGARPVPGGEPGRVHAVLPARRLHPPGALRPDLGLPPGGGLRGLGERAVRGLRGVPASPADERGAVPRAAAARQHVADPAAPVPVPDRFRGRRPVPARSPQPGRAASALGAHAPGRREHRLLAVPAERRDLHRRCAARGDRADFGGQLGPAALLLDRQRGPVLLVGHQLRPVRERYRGADPRAVGALHGVADDPGRLAILLGPRLRDPDQHRPGATTGRAPPTTTSTGTPGSRATPRPPARSRPASRSSRAASTRCCPASSTRT